MNRCNQCVGKNHRITELEAELKWWHDLVRKYHKNFERSNLQEIIQSFIDRIAELEAKQTDTEYLPDQIRETD